MTSLPHIQDAEHLSELVEDCREVSGMLAPFVLDLTAIPAARPPLPLEVPEAAATGLDGYGTYGS